MILITHGDFDHIGNAAYNRTRYGTKIGMGAEDAGMAERGDLFCGDLLDNTQIPKINSIMDDPVTACARVSTERYAAPTSCGTGRGGLRATMVHLLDSIWQQRITFQGHYKEPLADEAAYDATDLHEDTIPIFAVLQER